MPLTLIGQPKCFTYPIIVLLIGLVKPKVVDSILSEPRIAVIVTGLGVVLFSGVSSELPVVCFWLWVAYFQCIRYYILIHLRSLLNQGKKKKSL